MPGPPCADRPCGPGSTCALDRQDPGPPSPTARSFQPPPRDGPSPARPHDCPFSSAAWNPFSAALITDSEKVRLPDTIRAAVPPTPGLDNHGKAAAKPANSTADGSVNARNAAKAPAHPARTRPMLNPSWLLAGLGRNWQIASNWPNWLSVTHSQSSTSSLRKYPKCATGPPNEVHPSIRNTANTSPGRLLPALGSIASSIRFLSASDLPRLNPFFMEFTSVRAKEHRLETRRLPSDR